MSYKDPDYQTKYQLIRREDLKKHAIDSITIGGIINQNKWDQWCMRNKNSAENNKQPYSDDFTNDIIFEMLVQGCFYCGQVATTIDRIVSTLGHTPDNCVASCYGCNNSKGAADPSTFIRKSYYRARGEYMDDITSIWFENKNKPRMDVYKRRAEKKGVAFDLTKECWNKLINGECKYCHRTPTTWFGIDRVVPKKGYILDKVVSCCFDCNLDKHDHDVETMMLRNEQIASRVDIGKLVINKYEEVILHKGNDKRAKKVYAYGNTYASQLAASRALGKGDNYVCQCITLGIKSDVIFEIIDD